MLGSSVPVAEAQNQRRSPGFVKGPETGCRCFSVGPFPLNPAQSVSLWVRRRIFAASRPSVTDGAPFCFHLSILTEACEPEGKKRKKIFKQPRCFSHLWSRRSDGSSSSAELMLNNGAKALDPLTPPAPASARHGNERNKQMRDRKTTASGRMFRAF